MRVGLGGAVTVTATERWLAEIRSGRAFTRGGFSGPTAATLSHLQLFNPAASGVTIIIRAVIVAVSATGLVAIVTHNTALTTLVGAGVNLLAGGAAGLGELRSLDNAVQLGTIADRLSLIADTPSDVVPEWFFELGAGEGILVNSENANVRTIATYHWIEL